MPTTDKSPALALGPRLRELREAAGWSRATLAGKAHVGATTIARIELVGHMPGLRTVKALADALGTSVSVLTDGEPDNEPAAASA